MQVTTEKEKGPSVKVTRSNFLGVRHYNALMRKNAINWRRTWCGSCCEIACPILLMFLIVYIRTLLEPYPSNIPNMYLLEQAYYPTSKFNPTSGQYEFTSPFKQQSTKSDFLAYAEYPFIDPNTNVYSVAADPRSPYLFDPPHCFVEEDAFYSPIVAVIRQQNQIEIDMIEQLEQLWFNQRLLANDNTSGMFGKYRIQYFDSAEEMAEYIGTKDYGITDDGICYGFQVIELADGKGYEIELFLNPIIPSWMQSTPDQKQHEAYETTTEAPNIESWNIVTQEGSLFLQNLAANSILRRQTGSPTAEISTIVVPIQSPPIQLDDFATFLGILMPLFTLLMYIPVLYRTVYRIVFEKVTRAKESMRMMGMGEAAYWLSWLTYYTVMNTILSTLAFAVTCINAWKSESVFYIWLFFWLYGQSLFGLLMITQSLFQSPRACAVVTTIVYFGTSMLQIIANDPDSPSRPVKYTLSMLFPTTNLFCGFGPLVEVDQSGVGIKASTLDVQVALFSIRDALVCFVIGGSLMLVIGFYLEYVLPKTYGQRRSPCFFLSCLCSLKFLKTKPGANVDPEDEVEMHELKYLNKNNFEPVPREIAQKEADGNILKITDLQKTYDNGFQAVKGVNLKMYTDQIFVLLGHNGAGKTTTISMLTGLYEQTYGRAELFNIDLFNDMSSVRQIMGVCPQHDVLFELLTVEEHLSIFYDLKGADPRHKKEEIEQLMADVGISDKRHALASTLSGGNKRKLSVCIALCGNSKFVILDEPTSGMDLSARRQLWNMLKKQKKGRIILLTTHYMDEADILGDRIAIMSNGQLEALGSSIFLKSKFGVGYSLTVVKSSAEQNSSVMQFMHKNLGDKVKLQSEIQQEMTIQIPEEYSSKFSQFFQLFDGSLQSLGVQSYGISISTLEEVFLKVGKIDMEKELPEAYATNTDRGLKDKVTTDDFNFRDNAHELNNSFLNNLSAVLYKRYASYRRSKKQIFNEVFVPILIMVVGIGLTQVPRDLTQPSRLQTPDRYVLPNQILMNPQTVVGDDATPISALIANLPGGQDAFSVELSDWRQQSTTQEKTTFLEFGQQVYDYGRSVADEPPYLYGSYAVYEADSSAHQYKFLSFANLTSEHAAYLFPQFMYQSILRTATNKPDFHFDLRISPYPPTDLIKQKFVWTNTNTLNFMASIAFGLVLTSVVSNLVVERLSGLKHLQLISGMQLKAYWVGNFIFDFVRMQLLSVSIVCLLAMFQLGHETSYLLLVVLPVGAIPFTYASSFVFTSDSGAQTMTIFLHFFVLSISSVMIFSLRIVATLQESGDFLHQLMHVVPTYALGSTMYCDLSCEDLANARKSPLATGPQLDADKWAFPNAPWDILSLFIHFFFWWALILVIEKGLFRCLRFDPKVKVSEDALNLDADVEKEALRVTSEGCKDIIQVQNFKKVFKTNTKKCCATAPLVAVSDLSFGLDSGECFALLGVNGAGKSTTFKSLTCEVKPSHGVIRIDGNNVQRNFEKARKLIGYCPQPNLIFEEMSVEEHLTYYAQIKGIPDSIRHQLTEAAINKLGLEQHRTKLAGKLSGGNQRKLCVAIALVGNPPIIFLDEPSAGMDPESRRFMWTVVGKISQQKQSAVVLTTHSMDEAEALSTKMGIMVKGGIFKCFGSSQHIKDKFGTGYVIEIKVRTLDEEELPKYRESLFTSDGQIHDAQNILDTGVKKLISRSLEELSENDAVRQAHSQLNLYAAVHDLSSIFGTVELLEKYGNYMRVRVARQSKSIGFTFGSVEGMRDKFDVSEYSVSQTTLEQIFQNFAELSFSENVQKFALNDKNQLCLH